MINKDGIKQVTDDVLTQISTITNITNGFLVYQVSEDDKVIISRTISDIKTDMKILAVNIDEHNPAVSEVFNKMGVSPIEYIIYLMNIIVFIEENILHKKRIILLKEEVVNAGHA